MDCLSKDVVSIIMKYIYNSVLKDLVCKTRSLHCGTVIMQNKRFEYGTWYSNSGDGSWGFAPRYTQSEFRKKLDRIEKKEYDPNFYKYLPSSGNRF